MSIPSFLLTPAHLLCLALFSLAPLATSRAGTYSQDFSAATFPSGSSIVNGSTVVLNGGDASKLSVSSPSSQKIFLWGNNNKALQLVGPLGAATASWRMPILDPGLEIQGFDATFNVEVFRSSATATPGAGWSLNFGAVPVGGDGAGEGGFVMPHGMTIAWDLFNSGGTDLPSIEVFSDGVSVGNFVHEAYSGGTFTLTNPATGGTTAAITYTPGTSGTSASTVQAAMRLVSGWGSVTVTGNAGGPWTVDHINVGAYATPVANAANLLPAGSSMTFKTVRPGTASLSAKWTFPDVLTDTPLLDDGAFTVTNPTTSLTTAPIPFNADGAAVQAAMRAISGWTAVTVTGNAGGPWNVDHGVVGAYANPVSDPAGLLPANSSLAVLSTTTGTATVNQKWSLTPRAYRPKVVNVHWDYDGLDVTYGGRTIFTNLSLPGFVPAIGDIFAFSGRNESSNTMNMFLDDVVLSTTPLQELQTNGVVITEFMADNAGTLEDEDVDNSDWIEIYNGTNAAINLSGYRLTNAAGNNSMWTFPSLSLPSYAYKIIYASGKNRTIPTGLLHTNFTLQKEAGYLALIKPDGVTKNSEFNYGLQYEDISYGEKGPAHTLGYLYPPTPGVKTAFSDFQAPQGPAEDVVWSRVGGLIPTIVENGTANGVAAPPTVVTIVAPVSPGSVIRYTTDNTEPNSASPIYNPASPPAAFSVTSTINLRARIFTTNKLPGATSSRTFIAMDRSLTKYNNAANTSQPFSSTLPILVLDSFGVPVDNYTSADNRPYRFTYAVALEKDPVSGRATITQPTVDFQGRGGTHVRGSSSAGFPQHQYAWEMWDNYNNDKDAAVFGMPAESDWILYAPYNDKVLFRNHFIYSRMRELKAQDGYAMRTRMCEVFFNQEAGQPLSYSDYRGVYVLVEKIKINKARVDVQKINSLTTDPAAITGGYIVKHDRVNAGDTTINTSGGAASVTIGSVDPDAWNAAQTSYLQTYFNNFEAALAGSNFGDPAVGYQAYIDRDSFIYNQWFVEIAKQIDGYRLSQFFWKDRGGKLINGPLWDYNLALGNADYLEGWIPTGWYYPQLGGQDYAWYPRLHQHTTGASPYELRHWDLYWELRRGIFSTTTAMATIDAMEAELLDGSTTKVENSMPPIAPLVENPARRHHAKWPRLGIYDWPNPPGFASRIYYNSYDYSPNPAPGYTATGEVDFMKDWLTKRLNWIDDQNIGVSGGSVIYRPPNLSNYGGSVASNFPLTITPYTGTPPANFTYATGSIYYTLNGTDPRGSNGQPAGTLYTGTISLNATQTVKARLYHSGSGNWSPASTANFVVNSVPASSANLVISEIHYAPSAPTTGSGSETAAGYTAASMFEYIELLNVSGQNVDLSECTISVAVNYDFINANPADLSLAPGQRVVVVGNKNAFFFRYGNNPSVKIIGEFTNNLNNGGERVLMLAKNGGIIADINYLPYEPWPVDAFSGGYSLVLNNPAPNPAYSSGSSWRSSPQIGGSPGLTNTQVFAGSPSADTDKDGLTDFLEYAMGSSWSAANSRAETIIQLIEDPPFAPLGTYLEFSFPRNLWADGVLYSAEHSTSLTGWDPAGLVYLETHNNGNGTATVKYRSADPVDSNTIRSFLRLEVSSAP